MRQSLALILVVAGIAGCAPMERAAPGAGVAAADSGARQCFQPARIINFARGEAEQLNVRVLGGGVFSLRSSGCPDLGVTNSILVTPATGIGDRLCVGDSAQIVVPNAGFGPGRCIARVERALSDSEVEALPSRQRP